MTEQGTVTDAELDAAAEQSTPAESSEEATDTQETEPQEEEVKPEEQLPEEPADNRERSNLGRRVKSMEDTMQKFIEQAGMLIQSNIKPKDETPPEPEFPSDYIPTNVSELDRWYETKQKQETRKREAYQSSYRTQLDVLGQETPPEIHKAIINEMMENFNIKRSDSGMQDATTNYLNAKVKYLEKIVTAPKNPLSKNEGKDNKNLGGPAGSPSQQPKTPPPVKLDEYAAEFVRRIGMKDEQVNKALTGEMPTSLLGKK